MEPTIVRVSEFMSRIVISTPGTTPMLEARALMQKERIRHLLVVDDGRLVGIVTDRDMTRDVTAIGPERDVGEAARMMVDRKIGALPVLDGARLRGIITETDVLRAFVEGLDGGAKAMGGAP
jgi:acetoin utilization protein AcuB